MDLLIWSSNVSITTHTHIFYLRPVKYRTEKEDRETRETKTDDELRRKRRKDQTLYVKYLSGGLFRFIQHVNHTFLKTESKYILLTLGMKYMDTKNDSNNN